MTSPLIKKVCILFGCFTALLEIGVIVYIFATERKKVPTSNIELLAIGATFGLVVAVAWLLYAPQEKEAHAGIQNARGKTSSSVEPAPQEKFVPAENVIHEIINQQEAVSNINGTNLVIENKQPEKNMDMNKDEAGMGNEPGRQFQKPLLLRIPVEFHSRAFIVPKEGDDPALCADKYAQHIQNDFYRYAVTDGVSTSFLPAQWAQIIAESFVHLNNNFNESADGTPWLRACSQQWSQWVDTTWIPQLGHDKDWSRDKAQGAQTTLIGCSFSNQSLQKTEMANVDVVAVGDANFFLVRPLEENLVRYQYWSFPCIRPEDFGSVPDTLATAEDLIPRTQFKRNFYPVQRGDYIFLATDALARWTLIRIFHGDNPWQLLSKVSTPEDFHAFVMGEREKGEIASDDTTMLRIYIA